MRIVAALHGYPPIHMAGAETMAHAILKWMASRGHDVTVLTAANMLGGPGRGELDGVRVICQSSPVEEHSLYAAADVILTHLDLTRRTVNLAKKIGRPVAHLIHNSNQMRFWNLAPEEVALAVYNSAWLAHEVRFPAPSIIVNPPLFFDEYATEPDPVHGRDSIVLSNLNENKGGPLFWWLARQFPDRRFAALKGAYDEQHVGGLPNVTVHAQMSDVRPVLARTRIQLMPSRIETWGRAAVEACCSGIPVIANPTLGLVEALGKDGAIWVNREDHASWARAVELLDDPETYQHFSSAARRRAVELDRLAHPQLLALESAFLSVGAGGRARVFPVVSCEVEADHAAPVMHALPPERRGVALAYGDGFVPALAAGMVAAPVEWNTPSVEVDRLVRSVASPEGSIALAMSYTSQKRLDRLCLASRFVRMEAGAGQTYREDSPHFAGSNIEEGCLAWLVPGEHAAARVEAQEEGWARIVGSPRMDRWSRGPIGSLHLQGDLTVVALCLRPDMETSIPELSGDQHAALEGIKLLEHEGYTVLACAHPSWATEVKTWLAGIVPVVPFERVLETAHVMVCDNSSAGLEFEAATGRPCVWLDLPRYRTWQRPGLRFWDLGLRRSPWPGIVPAVQAALREGPASPPWRDQVFAHWGRAGKVAALALEGVLQKLRPGDDHELVLVCDSCMGEYGMLKAGTSLWMKREKAVALAAKGLVQVIDRSGRRPEPPPRPRDFLGQERKGADLEVALQWITA